jgi:hypothetical protein
MERFTLKKLNDVKVKEYNQVKIASWFAALENLDDGIMMWASKGLGKVLERI